MKTSNGSGIFKPFENLQSLLERESFPLKPASSPEPNQAAETQSGHCDEDLIFKAAMAGVKEIARTNCGSHHPPLQKTNGLEGCLEDDCLAQLKQLVKYGTGFVVSHTSEYIEGTGHRVNPDIARRLHRGDFSIQAHIDLHGLCVRDARQAFETFLNQIIISGKRAVLIIHGRGLSSPAIPVLKTKVYQWLTSSPWHRWVMAFTSARLCDGGAGATYVLLRQRPLTKRFRKKRKST